MDVKLTLKLDDEVIRKAKVFALEHQTSLSKLIENYLQKLTNEPHQEELITPIVKELSGILDLETLTTLNGTLNEK
jgi:hypothetical protein